MNEYQKRLRFLRKHSQDAAAFVLAGGRSSRMGQEKALLKIRGEPLVASVQMLLRAAGLAVWIAGSRSPALAEFGAVIPDLWENAGPLGGICSALTCTDREWAVFATVDQPLLAPNLITRFLDSARTNNCAATVMSVGGVAQTFPAVLKRAALPILQDRLEQGLLGCITAFREAGLHVVPAEALTPPESWHMIDAWFTNINTPEDLESVRQSHGVAENDE